ncbi:MAG: hypothetical protein ACERLB_06785 [Gammaproteobacteria bacterium]
MNIKRLFTGLVQLLVVAAVATLTVSTPLQAQEGVKPFILVAKIAGEDISAVVTSTGAKLQQAGFEVIGQYSPYNGAQVIVFTNDKLRNTATRSERGGYGAALRAAVTSNQGMIELAYTNPVYWANAYRLGDDLDDVSGALKSALGSQQSFGTGDKNLSASDMRDFHYTFMMEYFDDPSILAFFDSHEAAVETVNRNLSEGVAASKKVYQLDLGADSTGKPMTLIGVGLGGVNEDDCSGDAYIMGRIDKSSPRHTAHLPYEVLVYGDNVEALFGRFRIAISWPHLPMMASETGATFFSIMCAPGAIEDSLTQVAGGSSEQEFSNEK